MAQRSMDNIFHVVQLVRLKCPIQHLDRIHASQCPVQLYCCHLLSDLCALNQSECPVQRRPHTYIDGELNQSKVRISEDNNKTEIQKEERKKGRKIVSDTNNKKNKQETHKQQSKFNVMLGNSVNKLNIYSENTRFAIGFLFLLLLLL